MFPFRVTDVRSHERSRRKSKVDEFNAETWACSRKNRKTKETSTKHFSVIELNSDTIEIHSILQTNTSPLLEGRIEISS